MYNEALNGQIDFACEQTFMEWKVVWKIMLGGSFFSSNPEMYKKIIRASAILHNYRKLLTYVELKLFYTFTWNEQKKNHLFINNTKL